MLSAEMPTGTKEVDERHRFDPTRLEELMREEIEELSGPLQVRQFRGGQSNPTYELSDGTHRWVLRRKPPGELLKSAHAVDREFRVQKALAGTDVPVPRMYAPCEDEDVIRKLAAVVREYLAGTAIYMHDPGAELHVDLRVVIE